MGELGDERQRSDRLGADPFERQERLEIGGLRLVGREQHPAQVARPHVALDVHVVAFR